jgi:hypothetical protein
MSPVSSPVLVVVPSGQGRQAGRPAVAVNLQLQGQPTAEVLTTALNQPRDVLEVTASDLATGDA